MIDFSLKQLNCKNKFQTHENNFTLGEDKKYE